LDRFAVFVFIAAAWVAVGIAMLAWPARVRSVTNPDWRRFQKWPLAGTSLVWYRLTGLGFVAMGTFLIYVLVNRVQ